MKKAIRFCLMFSAVFVLFAFFGICASAATELNIADGSIVITSTGYSVDGRGVTLEPSSTGLSCTVTATVDGDAVIEAYLVDKNGNRLKDIDGKAIADREGISSEVNAWMMIIWYLKRIFGLI